MVQTRGIGEGRQAPQAGQSMFVWLKNERTIRRIGRWFGWISLALVLLTILTGYGITQFRIVTPLTAGFLGKAVSQHWHESLGLLVLAALAVHVGIALWWRWKGTRD